jgi:hypothetical protein
MKTIDQVFPREKHKHIIYHKNMSESMTQGDSEIQDLIETLKQLKKSYKDKLYWAIERYQDEPDYSLVVYTMKPQTDAQWKESMERRLRLIESNLAESQERRDIIANTLKEMK